MRRLIWVGAIATMLLVAACSTNKSTDTASTPQAPIVLPPVGVNNRCLPGQLKDANGYCLERDPNCGQGYGRDVRTNQCVPGTPATNQYGYYNLFFGSSLSIVDKGAFERLIKDYSMGCYITYWDIGNSFGYYASSGYVDIQIRDKTAKQATVTIGAGVNGPDNWYQNHIPMYFEMTVYQTGNSVGVSLQSASGLGRCTNSYASGLTINAASQNFNNSYLDVLLYYNNTLFARSRIFAYEP